MVVVVVVVASVSVNVLCFLAEHRAVSISKLVALLSLSLSLSGEKWLAVVIPIIVGSQKH